MGVEAATDDLPVNVTAMGAACRRLTFGACAHVHLLLLRMKVPGVHIDSTAVQADTKM